MKCVPEGKLCVSSSAVEKQERLRRRASDADEVFRPGMRVEIKARPSSSKTPKLRRNHFIPFKARMFFGDLIQRPFACPGYLISRLWRDDLTVSRTLHNLASEPERISPTSVGKRSCRRGRGSSARSGSRSGLLSDEQGTRGRSLSIVPFAVGSSIDSAPGRNVCLWRRHRNRLRR